LPGSEIFTQTGKGVYDLVVSLDCSDRRRMGAVYTPALERLPLLNIDHHVTNTRFGLVNWVDPNSVATSQMVLTLAEALDWPLSRLTATCLLTGLVTDTRAFRTANVGLPVMRAAVRLMEAGAPLAEITHQVLDYRSLDKIYVWGQAFERIQLEGGVLWTEVTRAMRQRFSAREEVSAGLSSFLAGVREAQVAVVFTERDNGTVDVSMRAAPGCDVAQVALRLGGGGHPRAAGCSLEGSLDQAKALVLRELRRCLTDRQPLTADG
ncbi:MAG TPA: bifunctional oligoribonuclease/PAP phosphatase NrnA, partial [Anaerolineae bacterium]|nr:bifunctional oligoribonuclease/PAP phosphatase NrnA [Anaerolineae bacterium]